ncbi:hypothetical protein CR105_25070 [Massilia eurypsychrophila]|uniref:DUF488 domain-containing protein n=1 Tax=Massilia eurypsychrophila TaxID=1485217 RepID=A0A2G8T894_9BURK|nr:DUF488 domain-containing protein [Massilia eurypsychrophila]PIL42275.1 hypothetical protein CR105_25070 [Massilia eurypsychrophila]
MKIFTIGFTRTSAEDFLTRLKQSKAQRLVDVRLNNVSQLAGFAKRDDLRYFARQLCGIGYQHEVELAPTAPMLADYRAGHAAWDSYATSFLQLMAQRRIEQIDRDELAGACLLCSEDEPHHCHRRLVAEYLRDKWGDVDIVHLQAGRAAL